MIAAQHAGAEEVLTEARELLDPLRGIMRGLRPGDRDEKLIGIRVGELRRVHRFVLSAKRFAAEQGEQS